MGQTEGYKPINISEEAHLGIWREYIGRRNNKVGSLQNFSTKIVLLGLGKLKESPVGKNPFGAAHTK